jgi:hypothetical protein
MNSTEPGTVEEGEALTEKIHAGDVGLDAHGMRAGFGAGIDDPGAHGRPTGPLDPPVRSMIDSSSVLLPL